MKEWLGDLAHRYYRHHYKSVPTILEITGLRKMAQGNWDYINKTTFGLLEEIAVLSYIDRVDLIKIIETVQKLSDNQAKQILEFNLYKDDLEPARKIFWYSKQ